jgi:hypothetical protein
MFHHIRHWLAENKTRISEGRVILTWLIKTTRKKSEISMVETSILEWQKQLKPKLCRNVQWIVLYEIFGFVSIRNRRWLPPPQGIDVSTIRSHSLGFNCFCHSRIDVSTIRSHSLGFNCFCHSRIDVSTIRSHSSQTMWSYGRDIYSGMTKTIKTQTM